MPGARARSRHSRDRLKEDNPTDGFRGQAKVVGTICPDHGNGAQVAGGAPPPGAIFDRASRQKATRYYIITATAVQIP